MSGIRNHKLVLTLAPAFAAFFLVQACGGGGDALAQEVVADPIEGVWEGPVVLRDCTTSAQVGAFQGSQVFHRGGTVGDTNSAPIASRGPGFGTWVKSGGNYIVKFRLFTYDAAGNANGIVRTTRIVTLGAAAGTATSVNTTQVFDLAGTLVRSGCGTDTSTRVL